LDSLVQQGDQYLDRETMSPYSGPVFSTFEDDTTKIRLLGTVRGEVYTTGNVTTETVR
jgi:hypothetical protein